MFLHVTVEQYISFSFADLTSIEPPRLLMPTKGPFMYNLRHFEAQWRPLMAIPDPGNGPHKSPRMCLTLTQPCSVLIHHFGASMPANAHKRAIYGQFEPLIAITDLKNGPNTSPQMCPALIQP